MTARFHIALLLCFTLVAPVFAEEELKSNPKAAAEAFDEGEALREEGKWEGAAEAYWRAIEADVRHYRAHVRYQSSSLNSGRSLAEVVGDYDALVTDYPDVPSMKLHRQRLNPAAKRIEPLTAILKANAKSHDAMLELGRAHLAIGEADDAAKLLSKAAAIAPSDRVDVPLLLAEAQIQAGEADDAAKRMNAAVSANPQFWLGHLMLARIALHEKQFDEALQRAETVLEQRPSYVAAFLLRSQALIGQKKPDEALKVIQAAHRLAPASPDVLVALADLTARSGEEKALKAALPLYKQVLDKNEAHVHALYGSAWVQERLKAFDKAEDLYRQVALLLPKSVEAVNSVGYCLLKQGRVSEAQIQFKRALDIDEDFVTALANLGGTYDAQSKFTDAIKIYEKILKMKGQKENLRALINAAFDHEALTSYKKAAKLLERAHKILPEDANICVWLGDNTYFQKKWNSAEKWYKEAVKRDDKSYFAWRGLGYSLAQKKKWEDAIAALEKAAELNAEEKDLLVIIGDIYLSELDDTEKAKNAYEKYVARGGDEPEVLDLLEELRADDGG